MSVNRLAVAAVGLLGLILLIQSLGNAIEYFNLLLIARGNPHLAQPGTLLRSGVVPLLTFAFGSLLVAFRSWIARHLLLPREPETPPVHSPFTATVAVSLLGLWFVVVGIGSFLNRLGRTHPVSGSTAGDILGPSWLLLAGIALVALASRLGRWLTRDAGRGTDAA